MIEAVNAFADLVLAAPVAFAGFVGRRPGNDREAKLDDGIV